MYSDAHPWVPPLLPPTLKKPISVHWIECAAAPPLAPSADFGASKAFQGDTITEGMKSIKGSAFWMAPEVIKGTGVWAQVWLQALCGQA